MERHVLLAALRDFMNVERHSAATSVIVLHDMLPRNVADAARDRTTQDWAGDVYKLIGVLREYRPDLILIPVDTLPTGVLVVLGPDHTSTVLRDHYEEIVARNVVPDPQTVPDWVLERLDAVDPQALLHSDFARTITRSRRVRVPASQVRARLRRELTPLIATARTPTPSGGTRS